MSCNGCRVLRKGCNENCILRQSLSTIETAQAQANATLFVAKFFGRAGLLSFLSAVPEYQRPALFESLLLEACGRTVNPVNGAVGLVCTGKWQLCLSAVATVLRGGSIGPMAQLVTDHGSPIINAMINCRSLIPDDHQDLQPLLITTKGNSHDDRWTKKRPTTATSFQLSETTTLESATDSASSQTKLLHLFF